MLAIGDEVLRGEMVNSNAAWLADRLFDLGYRIQEHRVISDDVSDIRQTLERLSSGLAAWTSWWPPGAWAPPTTTGPSTWSRACWGWIR